MVAFVYAVFVHLGFFPIASFMRCRLSFCLFLSLVLFLSFVSSPPLLSALISHRLLTCTQRRQRIPSSRVDGRSGVDGLVNTKSVPIVPIVQTVQLVRDD